MTDSPLEAGAAPVVLAATLPSVDHRRRVALTIAGAQRGDSEALAVYGGADRELDPDLAGVLPPSYQTEIIGGRGAPRPLFSVFGGRSLPSSGLAIVKPKWGTTPNGGWLNPITADAPRIKRPSARNRPT